jgi:hypothetical protein
MDPRRFGAAKANLAKGLFRLDASNQLCQLFKLYLSVTNRNILNKYNGSLCWRRASSETNKEQKNQTKERMKVTEHLLTVNKTYFKLVDSRTALPPRKFD